MLSTLGWTLSHLSLGECLRCFDIRLSVDFAQNYSSDGLRKSILVRHTHAGRIHSVFLRQLPNTTQPYSRTPRSQQCVFGLIPKT